MKLPAQLITDLKDATQLATLTNDPRRMKNAADWLSVIAAQIAAHVELHLASAAFVTPPEGREF